MNRRIRVKQLKNPLYSNAAFCANLARCEDECDGCDYPAITYLKRQLKKHGYRKDNIGCSRIFCVAVK